MHSISRLSVTHRKVQSLIRIGRFSESVKRALIVSAFECWSVIFRFSIRIVGGLWRSPPQTGLLVFLLFYDPVPVLHGGNAGPHFVKLRSCDHVLSRPWKFGIDLLLRLRDPALDRWMGGEDFRHRARLDLFLCLDLLEETHERLRIVARFVHVLQSQVIRLL